MIETERLIYLQMQKTACSHITRLIKLTCPVTREGILHSGLGDDSPVPDKFILGSIRNPWEWYVSLWAFGCAAQGDFFHRVTTGAQTAAFPFNFLRRAFLPARAWKECYRDSRSPRLFRRWLKLVYHPLRRRDLGEGYHEHPMSRFAGFMTWRYCRLYVRRLFSEDVLSRCAGPEPLKQIARENFLPQWMIRSENLADDFLEGMKRAGYQLHADQIETVRGARRTNPSDHAPYRGYYDDQTRALVAEKERLIIDRYGYTFME